MTGIVILAGVVALAVVGYMGDVEWAATEVVRTPDGCPNLPPSHATPAPQTAARVVPRETAPTVIDHAVEAPDVRGVFADARAVLGGFGVIGTMVLPSSGIEIELRSDGPLSIDEAELDALARLPLERHATFSDARVAALLRCYQERVMVERELQGTKLRLYVPSDHATCFSHGRLARVGKGGFTATCDAAGVTLPGLPLRINLFGKEVARFDNDPAIIVSGAAATPETADERLASHLLHELVHHYDNHMGLGPWNGPLSHYEQRAYYVERTLRASLKDEGGLPTPVRYSGGRLVANEEPAG